MPTCGAHPAWGKLQAESDPSPAPGHTGVTPVTNIFVTDSAFGARSDLVYSGEAVEIAGLAELAPA